MFEDNFFEAIEEGSEDTKREKTKKDKKNRPPAIYLKTLARAFLNLPSFPTATEKERTRITSCPLRLP